MNTFIQSSSFWIRSSSCLRSIRRQTVGRSLKYFVLFTHLHNTLGLEPEYVTFSASLHAPEISSKYSRLADWWIINLLQICCSCSQDDSLKRFCTIYLLSVNEEYYSCCFQISPTLRWSQAPPSTLRRRRTQPGWHMATAIITSIKSLLIFFAIISAI